MRPPSVHGYYQGLGSYVLLRVMLHYPDGEEHNCGVLDVPKPDWPSVQRRLMRIFDSLTECEPEGERMSEEEQPRRRPPRHPRQGVRRKSRSPWR